MNFKKATVAAAAFATPGRRLPPAIKDTAKTRNLQVKLPQNDNKNQLSVGDMEGHLQTIGSDMGLYISHVTSLGRRRYPGNRHWHFKQDPKKPGCLDVTYWPGDCLMWISIRKKEPEWVQEAGVELQQRLETTFADT